MGGALSDKSRDISVTAKDNPSPHCLFVVNPFISKRTSDSGGSIVVNRYNKRIMDFGYFAYQHFFFFNLFKFYYLLKRPPLTEHSLNFAYLPTF